MTTRRSVLAGSLVGGLAVTGGCLGFVTGSEPLAFEASRAGVPASVLGETGYSLYEYDEQRIEESVEFGVERDIEATFSTVAYTKEVAVQGTTMEAAAFAVVSMPAMEVLGESRNPVADMSGREVVDEAKDSFESEYGNIRDVSHEGTRQGSILGESRTIDVYHGVADVEGRAVDIVIHIAVVEEGDDLIILFGGHPRQLPGEELTVDRLMESVEHPLDGAEADDQAGDDPGDSPDGDGDSGGDPFAGNDDDEGGGDAFGDGDDEDEGDGVFG